MPTPRPNRSPRPSNPKQSTRPDPAGTRREPTADTDWVAFGSWLREQREAQGLTRHAVQQRGGPGASVIESLEDANIGRQGPRGDTLVRLAGALNLDPDIMLVRAGFAPLRRRLDRDPVTEVLDEIITMTNDEITELLHHLRRQRRR